MQEKRAVAPKAIDHSHHLSTISRARQISPLKGLQKYWGKEGLISLAGGTSRLLWSKKSAKHPVPSPGMPDPAYFPFSSISADALVPNSYARPGANDSSLFDWFWNMFGGTEKSERFTIPKFGAKKGDIELSTSLQYSGYSSSSKSSALITAHSLVPTTGIAAVQSFIHDFSELAYPPPYADWRTLVSGGNTDGWVKISSRVKVFLILVKYASLRHHVVGSRRIHNHRRIFLSFSISMCQTHGCQDRRYQSRWPGHERDWSRTCAVYVGWESARSQTVCTKRKVFLNCELTHLPFQTTCDVHRSYWSEPHRRCKNSLVIYFSYPLTSDVDHGQGKEIGYIWYLR